MNIEKRPYEAAINTYTTSLDGKKLSITFSDILENGKEKKVAHFLQHNQYSLRELDRVVIDSAAEQTDDPSGDTILILRRNNIEFRFWKYDDGAFGAHYVLKNIEHTGDQDVSQVQKHLLEKLSNKKNDRNYFKIE